MRIYDGHIRNVRVRNNMRIYDGHIRNVRVRNNVRIRDIRIRNPMVGIVIPFMGIKVDVTGNFIVFAWVADNTVVIIGLPQRVMTVEFWNGQVILVNPIVNPFYGSRLEPGHE